MRKKTPRIGRPPKDPAQRRDRQPRPLNVKLTPAERELFDRAAAAAGRPVTVWARELLLRAARRLVGG